MPDSKITALTSISTSTDPANDPLVIVDVSDTSMAATGTTKKVTLNQLLGASGTATLASATITGDLTVRTNKLKVDATGVAIGATSASYLFDVRGTDTTNVLFAGVSKGIRFTQSASTSAITGVDNTGGASYQPLSIGGSALDFSLSGTTAMTLNSTGLGVGVSPSYKLDVTDNSTNIQARLNSSNNNGTSLRFVNTGTSGRTWQIGTGFAVTAGNFEIYDVTAAVNRLSIDSSGNVGIGVTPSYKLDVRGSDNSVIAQFGGTNRQVRFVTAANGGFDNANFIVRHDSSVGGFLWQNNNGSNTLLTIDASGNVGIGVTPSAWNSTYRSIDIGSIGSIAGRTGASNTVDVTSNGFRDGSGNWIYKISSSVSRYTLDGSTGSHFWYTAPSGTAGNAITFTQAMTLDASGRLLVGPTSANASGGVLQLSSGITFPATQVASSDANTLDDYEEGTWTGTITGSTTNPTTPVTATGRYTKIGQLVTVQIAFSPVDTTGASGQVRISGLPFTNNSSIASPVTVVAGQIATFTGMIGGLVLAGSTIIRLYSFASNGALADATHNAGSGRELFLHLTYTV